MDMLATFDRSAKLPAFRSNCSTAADSRFSVSDQPFVGLIDTDFKIAQLELDPRRIIWGQNYLKTEPTLLVQKPTHGTSILSIITSQSQDKANSDNFPLWLGRAVGSGRWAESLIEFAETAKRWRRTNAVINLSFDLIQTHPDQSVTTRFELTPYEQAALEYAHQLGILVVAAAGNTAGAMSALGQAAQQFDNMITVGAAEHDSRAAYSSYGGGLTLLADGRLDNTVGTSIAAARVTQAISKIWAVNPRLSYRQVADILQATATPLQDTAQTTGAGLLNVTQAIHLAMETLPVSSNLPLKIMPPAWLEQTVAGTSTMGERPAWGLPNPIDLAEDIGKGAVDIGKDVGNTAIDVAQNVGNTAVNTVQNVGNTVVNTAQHFGNSAIGIAQHFGNTAVNTAQHFGNSTIGIAQHFGNVAVNTAQKVGNTAINAAQNAGNTIIDTTQTVANTAIDGTQTAIGAVAGNTIGGAINHVIDQAQGVVNDAVNTAQAVGNAAVDTVQSVDNTIVDTAQTVGNAAIDTAKVVGNTAINTVQTVDNKIVDTAQIVGNAAVDTAQAAGNAANSVKDKVSDATSWVFDKAGDATNIVLDKAGDVANWTLDQSGNVANWTLDKVGDGAKWVFDQVGLDSVGSAIDKTLDKTGSVTKTIFDKVGDISNAAIDEAGIVSDTILDTVGDGPDAVVAKVGGKLVGALQRGEYWVTNLPDRFKRLGQDYWDTVSSLSQGHLKDAAAAWAKTRLDWVEIAGVPELVETAADVLKLNARPLNNQEMAIAKSVFGDSINLDLVRIDEQSRSVSAAKDINNGDKNRPFTTFHTINTWGPLEPKTLIHELTHVWQYEHDGAVYIPQALAGQHSTAGYTYSLTDLENQRAAGKGLTDEPFNREQQAHIIEDYYDKRENGIKGDMQQESDLASYTYFVREVSSLYKSATTSQTLRAADHNLVLLGSDPINGIGNAGDNEITGNDAKNRLDGNDGNDRLLGRDGNDQLNGGRGQDHLFGGNGSDILTGGAGNDLLVGGAGNDTLTGGTGKDQFGFLAPTDGIDTIRDFSVTDDVIKISRSGFKLSDGNMTADQFHIGSAAASGTDHFIYNASNGKLFFDADGTGAAAQVQIAKLSPGLALTYHNIVIG
jgi:hypothetical protein